MKKHFAVSGFVVNRKQTKLLMVYHKKLDTWVIPGGHLESNEYPHEGALREIKEETGIEAEVIDVSNFVIPKNGKESAMPLPCMILEEFIPGKGNKEAHIHMDLIYLCMADEKEVIKQEAEVNDVKWMTWQEVLESGTFESIKVFVKKIQGGEIKCENLGSS